MVAHHRFAVASLALFLFVRIGQSSRSAAEEEEVSGQCDVMASPLCAARRSQAMLQVSYDNVNVGVKHKRRHHHAREETTGAPVADDPSTAAPSVADDPAPTTVPPTADVPASTAPPIADVPAPSTQAPVAEVTTLPPTAAPVTTPAVTTSAPVETEVMEAVATPETLAAHNECTPTCSYQCDSPECDRVCTPVCQPPACETRCKGADTSGCVMECNQPRCWTICPKNTPSGPMCTTECGDPQCELKCPAVQQCRSLCATPECEPSCTTPVDCPKPRCNLVCEEPTKCQTEQVRHELPPLADDELKVHSFDAPVNMRAGVPMQQVGLAQSNFTVDDAAGSVPALVISRSKRYMVRIPVGDGAEFAPAALKRDDDEDEEDEEEA